MRIHGIKPAKKPAMVLKEKDPNGIYILEGSQNSSVTACDTLCEDNDHHQSRTTAPKKHRATPRNPCDWFIGRDAIPEQPLRGILKRGPPDREPPRQAPDLKIAGVVGGVVRSRRPLRVNKKNLAKTLTVCTTACLEGILGRVDPPPTSDSTPTQAELQDMMLRNDRERLELERREKQYYQFTVPLNKGIARRNGYSPRHMQTYRAEHANEEYRMMTDREDNESQRAQIQALMCKHKQAVSPIAKQEQMEHLREPTVRFNLTPQVMKPSRKRWSCGCFWFGGKDTDSILDGEEVQICN